MLTDEKLNALGEKADLAAPFSGHVDVHFIELQGLIELARHGKACMDAGIVPDLMRALWEANQAMEAQRKIAFIKAAEQKLHETETKGVTR